MDNSFKAGSIEIGARMAKVAKKIIDDLLTNLMWSLSNFEVFIHLEYVS